MLDLHSTADHRHVNQTDQQEIPTLDYFYLLSWVKSFLAMYCALYSFAERIFVKKSFISCKLLFGPSRFLIHLPLGKKDSCFMTINTRKHFLTCCVTAVLQSVDHSVGQFL